MSASAQTRRLISKSDLYALIINQLMEDGLEDAAHVVANAVQLGVQAPQRIVADRLTTLCENGLRFEQQSSNILLSTTAASSSMMNDNNFSVFSSSTVPASSSSFQQYADGFDTDGDADLLAEPSTLPSIDFDKPDDGVLPRVYCLFVFWVFFSVLR